MLKELREAAKAASHGVMTPIKIRGKVIAYLVSPEDARLLRKMEQKEDKRLAKAVAAAKREARRKGWIYVADARKI
jgi:hypothetical protein